MTAITLSVISRHAGRRPDQMPPTSSQWSGRSTLVRPQDGGVAIGLERQRREQVDRRQADAERQRRREGEQRPRPAPGEDQRIRRDQEQAGEQGERQMGGDQRRISERGERRPLALRDPLQAQSEQRDEGDGAGLGERAAAVEIGEMIRRRHEEEGDAASGWLVQPSRPAIHGRARARRRRGRRWRRSRHPGVSPSAASSPAG